MFRMSMGVCAAYLILSAGFTVQAVVPEEGAFSRGHRDLVAESAFQSTGWNKKILAAIASQRQKLNDSMEIEREVLGYLPYWTMDDAELPWDLLTIFAWFGVGMDETGQATEWHGWGGSETEELVAQSLAHGVTPIVTITNFDNDGIATLLSSTTHQATAIETCLTVMAVHGAEGVNIDFEMVPVSVKAEFVTFMTDLKAAVSEAQPNGKEGHVSLAGPAVDWNGSYDYDQLLVHTDGIMVMAYGYHWGGGDPGPVSPLFGGGKWGVYSIAWTIDEYIEWGGFENRHKVLIGLPFYGREWPVANTDVPGVALGAGEAITMSVAEPEALANGKQWDDESKTAYYHKEVGGQLWQVWYEDQAAFGAKIAHVAEEDLGGIGIWALGYEGSKDDYWIELEDQWAVPVAEEPDGGVSDESDAVGSPQDGDAEPGTDVGPVSTDAEGNGSDDVGLVDDDAALGPDEGTLDGASGADTSDESPSDTTPEESREGTQEPSVESGSNAPVGGELSDGSTSAQTEGSGGSSGGCQAGMSESPAPLLWVALGLLLGFLSKPRNRRRHLRRLNT